MTAKLSDTIMYGELYYDTTPTKNKWYVPFKVGEYKDKEGFLYLGRILFNCKDNKIDVAFVTPAEGFSK